MRSVIDERMTRLQLLGLSRIDRCRACPRFAALRRDPANRAGEALPAPPPTCLHRACKPLARRFAAAAVARRPAPARDPMEGAEGERPAARVAGGCR